MRSALRASSSVMCRISVTSFKTETTPRSPMRWLMESEEIARLVVHGVLHTLGYDHPENEGREASDMWRRQERLLRRLVTRSGAKR